MSTVDRIVKAKKIVTLHKVSNEDNFKRQLEVIRKAGAVISVDDGDVSFYEKVYPNVMQYEIPTVLFVITGLIDSKIPFWWDEVLHHYGKGEGSRWLKKLKVMSNKDRIDFLDSMRSSANTTFHYLQLTTAQLKEMEGSGIVIGNHSHTHPMFDRCTEKELVNELMASKVFFESSGLDGYSTFAYPNGNHNHQVEELLKAHGIEYAFLFDHQLNSGRSNMRISRLSINDETSPAKLKFILSGWHSHVAPLARKINKLF